MRMILIAALALAPLCAKDAEPARRLNEAAAVFSEVMAAPDKGIPEDLLAKAHCIVIVPSLKTAAFVIGAKFGKGYLLCRNHDAEGWSAPATVRIEGGSVGFQIGGSETDLILLVMNEGGRGKLLQSKFTLGAEGSVAAGPVGRTATAQTDAQMHAEILSWSRSQGLFAGVALEGATLAPGLKDITVGHDDGAFSAIERIFLFANGPTGKDNPQRQGLNSALSDGLSPLNVLGGIPTVATDYSPLWDLNLGVWTKQSIDKGYRSRLLGEFQILDFAEKGFITGPNGGAFGSTGLIVNCPIVWRFL